MISKVAARFFSFFFVVSCVSGGGVSPAQFAAMRDELAELRRTSEAQHAADVASAERLARENDELAAGTRSATPATTNTAPAGVTTRPPQNLAPITNSFGAMMGAPSMGMPAPAAAGMMPGMLPPQRVFPFLSEQTAFLGSCPPDQGQCYAITFAGVRERVVEVMVNHLPASVNILRSRLPNRTFATSGVGGAIAPENRYTDWVPPSSSSDGRVSLYIPPFTNEGEDTTNSITLRVYCYNRATGAATSLACEIELPLSRRNWGSSYYSNGICP